MLKKNATQFIILFVLALLIILMIRFFSSMGNEPDGEGYLRLSFVVGAALAGSLVNQPFRDSRETSSDFSLILYIFWKALVSIIFAILLTLIFTAEILTGDLFPKFQATDDTFTSMIDYAKKVNPSTNKDLAKLLVWCFVAGFSEKFVPNIISNTLTRSP